MIIRTDQLEPGFYVTDSFAATLEAAVVSGPYDSTDAADRALNDCNIAGDCDVVEVRPAARMFSTEYAALTHGSSPETSQYVKRDGQIIGAVIRVRDNSGQWRAYMADDLLDLRHGVTCADRDAAIATVIADAD